MARGWESLSNFPERILLAGYRAGVSKNQQQSLILWDVELVWNDDIEWWWGSLGWLWMKVTSQALKFHGGFQLWRNLADYFFCGEYLEGQLLNCSKIQKHLFEGIGEVPGNQATKWPNHKVKGSREKLNSAFPSILWSIRGQQSFW